VLLKNPVALKVLVWSSGWLAILLILTSSSFSLLEETHGSSGRCVCLLFLIRLLQDASGHSNVLEAGKAEELKIARKRRTARKANKLRARSKGYKDSSG